MGSLSSNYEFFNIINDECRGSSDNHQVTDPRTEEALWNCPNATTQDLEDAIAAANKAFPAWAATTVDERQKLLIKMSEIVKDHATELTEVLMKETGKSVSRGSFQFYYLAFRVVAI